MIKTILFSTIQREIKAPVEAEAFGRVIPADIRRKSKRVITEGMEFFATNHRDRYDHCDHYDDANRHPGRNLRCT